MKGLKFTYAIISLITAFPLFLSCKKEPYSPDEAGKETTQYQQPLEEKILLSASGRIQTNGFIQSDGVTNILFASEYVYEKQSYNVVTIDNKYVKSIGETSTGIEITFPDDRTARFEYQKEVALDIDSRIELKGFPGDKTEIPFSVVKPGRGQLSVTITSQGKLSPELSFNADSKSGLLTFCFSPIPGAAESISFTLTDGKNKSEYTISATTYHFVVEAEDIILGGEAGATAELNYTIDTDIPEYEVAITPSGDFFSLSGKTVSALKENRSGGEFNGTITFAEKGKRFAETVISIKQQTLPPAPRTDCVPFIDWNFKTAMLAIADKDKDGEITFDEALLIKEIVAPAKGITNLSGLEYFKNVYKLDLQNNDIEDATCLKELHLLYWLDLKGNKNLKTFDVTGCTQYFEHCEFEITDELQYYAYRYQYGVAGNSDPYFKHSPDVADIRVTTDWTRHKNMTLIHRHTKTINSSDMPWIEKHKSTQEGMVPSIVFTGLSYIDVDLQNGSWTRLFNDACALFFESTIIGQYLEYFDVYFLEYLANSREEFYFEPNSYRHSDICESVLARLDEEDNRLNLYAYEALYGDTKWAISRFSGDVPSREYPAQLIVRFDCQPFKDFVVLNNRCTFSNASCLLPDDYTSDGREFQYKFIFSTNTRSRTQSVTSESIEEPTLKQLIGFLDVNYYEDFLRFACLIE